MDSEKTLGVSGVEGLMNKAVAAAKEFQRAAGELPKVDKNGSSECPFAEELYAKAEKCREKCQGLQVQLHECLTLVQNEIDKCGHDLSVLSAQKDQLNRDRPRAHFSAAEARIASMYKKWIQLRDSLKRTIVDIDDMLQQTKDKRYPGGMPQEWPNTGRFHPRQAPSDSRESESTGADKEIDRLFDMDRDSRKDNHKEAQDTDDNGKQ